MPGSIHCRVTLNLSIRMQLTLRGGTRWNREELCPPKGLLSYSLRAIISKALWTLAGIVQKSAHRHL
jgi:hypothetical protein